MPNIHRALCAIALAGTTATGALADTSYQILPFAQSWTNTGLITTNNDWSGVPGISGYRGDDLTGATGTDPQTIVTDGSGTPLNVLANLVTTTNTTGGLQEIESGNATVAMQGSGTADAPHLVLHLNTIGFSSITVSYDLRDLDASTDNAVQQFALQYRIGNSGDYTNVPTGYVADATTGPSVATLVTPVSVVLPPAANHQAQVQVRIITTNAAGNDELVAVDDLQVTGTEIPVAVDAVDWSAIKHLYR